MTAARPKLAESDVTAQVKDYLSARGWRPVRHNRGITQGFGGQVVQFGEPGIADFQFVFYLRGAMHAALSLTLWVEFKGAGVRARCRCLQIRGTRKRCTACDQANWRDRERARGALVWLVDDLDWFLAEYQRVFGWLHQGDRAQGQTELGLTT